MPDKHDCSKNIVFLSFLQSKNNSKKQEQGGGSLTREAGFEIRKLRVQVPLRPQAGVVTSVVDRSSNRRPRL